MEAVVVGLAVVAAVVFMIAKLRRAAKGGGCGCGCSGCKAHHPRRL